jgi:hypothetical protein
LAARGSLPVYLLFLDYLGNALLSIGDIFVLDELGLCH